MSSSQGANEVPSGQECGSPDSPAGISKDAVRKAKKRAAQRLAERIGISTPEAVDWLVDFDNFMPDASGLTSGEDLLRSFEDAFAGLKNLRTGVVYGKSSVTDQDAVDNVDGYFRDSKVMQDLVGSEADLMYGMLVAERAAAAYQLQAAEYSAIRSLLQAELVRRRSLAEVWKHNLPKSMLAFFAVMDRAGFSSKEMRVQAGLFGRFVDFVAAESSGKVDRAALMEAAVNSEEQFTGYGSDELGKALRAEREGISSEAERPQAVEPDGEPVAPSPRPGRVDSGRSDRIDRDVSAETNVQNEAAQKLPALPNELRDRIAEASQIRSTGFGLTRGDKPFEAYRYSAAAGPFQHMPLRDPGPEKKMSRVRLKPQDFVRLEMQATGYEIECLGGQSAILGRTDALMLPTLSEAAMYGSNLGWGTSEIRSAMPFGNLAEPEKMESGGNVQDLLRAMKGGAEMQIRRLVNEENSHLLSDPKAAAEAAEDLGRWWLFVTFVRLNPSKMLPALEAGFFHGVHGPDIAIEDGQPIFGDAHIRIIDPVQERLERSMTDSEIEAVHGPRAVRRRLFEKA